MTVGMFYLAFVYFAGSPSLEEVCALPSAVLVIIAFIGVVI